LYQGVSQEHKQRLVGDQGEGSELSAMMRDSPMQ
jgi:hypothetical protein